MANRRNLGYGTPAGLSKLAPNPIVSNRAPVSTDKGYPVGQDWIDSSTNSVYILGGYSSGNSVWVQTGSSGGSAINQVTGDSGVGTPIAGNLDVITSGGLIQTTGSAGQLEIASTSSAYPMTPYVVGSTGGYATIQSAINAANAAGGGLVYVQAGSYTESLTLFAGITILGEYAYTTQITGTITPPTSGTIVLQDVNLISTGNIFLQAVPSTVDITLDSCLITITDGILFNMPNHTGTLNVFHVGNNSTIDGFINSSAASNVVVSDSDVGAGGSARAAVKNSGSVLFEGSNISCSFVISGTAVVEFSRGSETSSFFSSSGSAQVTIDNSSFDSGVNAAIAHNSSQQLTILNSSFSTNNDPAIAGGGLGAVVLCNASFEDNYNLAGTLTLSTNSRSVNAGLKIVEGTNATMGSVALVAGAATVNTTAVTANSRIFLSNQTGVTNAGVLTVSARVAGTSFTITSTNGADTNTIAWWIVEPA